MSQSFLIPMIQPLNLLHTCYLSFVFHDWLCYNFAAKSRYYPTLVIILGYTFFCYSITFLHFTGCKVVHWNRANFVPDCAYSQCATSYIPLLCYLQMAKHDIRYTLLKWNQMVQHAQSNSQFSSSKALFTPKTFHTLSSFHTSIDYNFNTIFTTTAS